MDKIPHDIAAEAALIGSILIDDDVYKQSDLTPDDFWDPRHKEIFAALSPDVNNQVTVSYELSRRGKLEQIGGNAYLSEIIASTPTSLHADYFAQIIKNCAVNRRLISTGHQIMQMGYQNESPQQALTDAQILLAGITQKTGSKTFSAMELAKSAGDHYGKLRDKRPGLMTGFKCLDDKLGGILPAEYIILAANTSVGKTTLALQVARYIARNFPVLIVSLEMTAQAVTDKNVAALSGISTRLINNGCYPDTRIDAMFNGLGEMAKLNFHVTDAATTLKIRSEIERRAEIKFVLIDYLQKIRDKYGNSEYQRIGYISGELAAMAKDYNVPIMALSQLNRGNTDRENKRPTLSDLRESGKLEEDADSVWALYRESYFANKKGEVSDSNTTELLILKNRLRGNTGRDFLYFDKEWEKYSG